MISHIRRRTIFAGPFDIVELCLVSETLSCHCAEHTSCCLAIWRIPQYLLAIVVHQAQLLCDGSVVLVELIQYGLQRFARVLLKDRALDRKSEIPPWDFALEGDAVLENVVKLIYQDVQRACCETIHDSRSYHVGPPKA